MSESSNIRDSQSFPAATGAAGALPVEVRAQLTAICDKLHDAILLLDRDWRITYANAPAREISKIAEADLNGASLWDLYPGVENSDLGALYKIAAATRTEQIYKGFYYEPFGRTYDLCLIPSEDGIAVIYQNVTAKIEAEQERTAADERQRAKEQELLASEARYRVLAELSPQSLWTANAEGLVLYANQRFLTYIGKDFVPATGTEYIECFDPADRARVVEVWTHCVMTGDDYAIDARLIRASDGASRWWHLRALPVRAADGTIEQWLGSAVDMHDERVVHERLIEQIQQQQRAETALIQSEKLAAVGRLASSIAHEINNPLEAVMNLLYIAREATPDTETRQYLTLADQELRRVSIITNQTLRFHKQSTQPVEISCDSLFESVFSLYEGRLRNSNIDVLKRLRISSQVRCLEGDMRQVISNPCWQCD